MRFPAPRYYLTFKDHSKERFINSRLGSRERDQESNLSDEADIYTFTDRLISLVVNADH